MARQNGGKRVCAFSPTVHANRRTERIKLGESWKQGTTLEDRRVQEERMDDDYQEWFGIRPNQTIKW